MPSRLRAAVRRHGAATVVVLSLCGAFATANGFLTHAEKARRQEVLRMPAPPSVAPCASGAADADTDADAEDGPLRFTTFVRTGEDVEMSSAWTADAGIGLLELRSATRLDPPDWRIHAYWWDFSGPTNDTRTLSLGGGFGTAAYFLLRGHSLSADPDGDGLSNAREIALGTNPLDARSDGDRLTDGEEVGTVEELPDGEFLWFEMSGGADMSAWMTYCGYDWTGMWGGGHVAGGRTLDDAAMCLDGFVHLVSGSDRRDDLVCAWSAGNDLRATDFTHGGVTVMAVDADLRADAWLWGSGVFQGFATEGGRDYDVFEWRNVGPASATSADAPLATFEVIVPHAEPDTFYVSYLSVDAGFPVGAQVGVQDSARRSVRDSASYYAVSGDAGACGTRRTFRYRLGTNTDPCVTDAAWATLGQGEDWVRANFTCLRQVVPSLASADEILAAGYSAWVDSAVGSGQDNGLYRLTARITGEVPEGASFKVGELKVTPDGSDEYVFLLEKGVRYGLTTEPASFTNVVFSATDDVSPLRLASAGGVGSIQDGYWTEDAGEVMLAQVGWFRPGYVVYRPRLMVTPGNWQPTEGRPAETFTAVVSDLPARLEPGYRWHTSDSSVISVSSPTSRTTDMTCRFPAAASTQVSLALNVDLPGCTLHASYVNAPENPDARVRISFAIPDVMFANDDDDDGENGIDCHAPSDSDDDVVHGEIRFTSDVPTNGTLRIERIGGYWGDVFADPGMTDIVSAGRSWTVSRKKDFPITLHFNPYRRSSSYNGAGIVVRWIPEAGYELTATKRFTVVEPVVEPVCSDTTNVTVAGVTSRHVLNPCGIVTDEPAYFRIAVEPSDFPDERIVWTASNGNVWFARGDAGRRGRNVCVYGAAPGDVDLDIRIGDVGSSVGSSSRPRFTARVVDWSDVKVTCFVAGDGSGAPICETSEIDDMILKANEVLRQVGVRLHREGPVGVLDLPQNGVIAADEQSVVDDMVSFSNLVDHVSDTGGLEVYVVGSIRDVENEEGELTAGLHCNRGIAVGRQGGLGLTLAHEVGHALGMRDIYAVGNGESLTLEEVREDFLQHDWNHGCSGPSDRLPHWDGDAGAGSARYYTPGLLQSALIRRMLMNGLSDSEGCGLDITYGSVFGYDKEGAKESVATGMFYDGDPVPNNTRQPEHH